jgi:tetratricopeptide (TPR) repeat protein
LSTRRCKAGPRPAGNLLAQQGQIDKALADFDRALAINPRQADALARRGFALVHKGRTSEADVDFDRTLEFGSEWVRSRRGASRLAVELNCPIAVGIPRLPGRPMLGHASAKPTMQRAC